MKIEYGATRNCWLAGVTLAAASTRPRLAAGRVLIKGPLKWGAALALPGVGAACRPT